MMDSIKELRNCQVIMIGKPPEECSYTQGLVQELENLDISVHPLYVSGITNICRKIPMILRLLRRGKSVVHFQFYISIISYRTRTIAPLFVPLIPLMYLLFLFLGGRMITTFHTVYPLSAIRAKLSKHRSLILLNRATVTYWLLNIKTISWLSKKVIALTQAAKSTLEEEYGVRNAIYIPTSCYNAQSVDAYEAANFREKIHLEHGQKVMLLFGGPSKVKGFHHVIEALPEVVRGIPGVKLFIVGGTPRSPVGYLRSLKESAKLLNVEKSVMFFGRVSRHDIPYIISSADIGIFPYEKERGVVGSGALQEVLAYMKPIIVSDTPPFALLKNGETCLKVNVADNDELAKAIISLLSDRELHDNIVENLCRFVEEYSVTNEAMQCLRIYEEALD